MGSKRNLAVLHCDDDADLVEITKEYLKRHLSKRFVVYVRYHDTVMGAVESLLAYDSVVMHQADVVICDLRMPSEDGFRLIEFVRRHYPSILVVVYSGGHPDLDRVKSLRSRCSLDERMVFLSKNRRESVTELVEFILAHL